jgi:hypothetical protein
MASGGLAFPCQAAALLDAVRLDNQTSKSGYFTEASQTRRLLFTGQVVDAQRSETFRRNGLTRAIKAALAAGVGVTRAEIDSSTGKIVLFSANQMRLRETLTNGMALMSKIKLQYVQEYIDRHGKVRRYFRRP